MGMVKETMAALVDGVKADVVIEYLSGCRDDVDFVTVGGETYRRTGKDGTFNDSGAPSVE